MNYTHEAIIDPKHTIKSPNKKHLPQGKIPVLVASLASLRRSSFDAGSNYVTEKKGGKRKKEKKSP